MTQPEKTKFSTSTDFILAQSVEFSKKNIQTVAGKVFQLPLPSERYADKKSLSPKSFALLKFSNEKVIVDPTSIEKQDRSSATSSSSTTNSDCSVQLPAKEINSTEKNGRSSRRKFHENSLSQTIDSNKIRWDAPYVGDRVDPPTPPSSPASGLDSNEQFVISQQIEFI